MIVSQRDISISSVLAPFQFGNQSHLELYNDILHSFYDLLRNRLYRIKDMLKTAGKSQEEHLDQLLNQLDGVELDAYLFQPQVSNILLYGNTNEVLPIAGFLLETLSAQVAKKTHEFDPSLYSQLWSANGDYLISRDESGSGFVEYEAPRISDRVPIDFFSPYCQSLSQDDIQEDPLTKFELYSFEEAENVFEFMEASLGPVSDKNITELVCLFNNVVMVKKQVNPNGARPFISGSDGFYIGRTHVMNADKVDSEVIAEMFVHEAIHSVLYIIEEFRNWMPGFGDAARIGTSVPSNWSGNRLSIRSYFQAVFVWFGIFNFWKHALDHQLYDRERVVRRLQFVTNGFRTLDTAAIAREYGLRLGDETIETVEAAKKIVLSS
ncbi:MAG: hypothetical protein ABW019_05540 [Chitinophagaceae bacterium]